MDINEIECIIIASHLYQEILDAENPMKLLDRARGIIAETGEDFKERDVVEVMKSFKEKNNA